MYCRGDQIACNIYIYISGIDARLEGAIFIWKAGLFNSKTSTKCMLTLSPYLRMKWILGRSSYRIKA